MGREFNPESIPINPDPNNYLAIYGPNGEFAGIDNERGFEIIEKAVNFGVKIWGKKEAMAIQIGAHWLEGWMDGKGITDEVADCLRKAIKDFFFI